MREGPLRKERALSFWGYGVGPAAGRLFMLVWWPS